MRNLYLIIRREFLERVARKSFIITTILMPLIMIGVMITPALIMVFSGPEEKTIAVIDQSGVIAPILQSDDALSFEPLNESVSLESAKQLTMYDGILMIGSDIVENPNNVQLYTRSASSIQTESFINSQISDAVESIRIKSYDIDNLEEILNRVHVTTTLSSYRIDNEKEEATSSMASYFIGLTMAMMLYMFIMIYGQMVMTSIIEEKNNRVLEIIVSSVKPKILMLGKIIGIGLVAVTQILIWAVLIACFTRWIMPMITVGLSSDDPELMAALSQLGDTTHILMLFLYILLFLIGGFMLYSSIYAAIGSAVDNIQDASQLSSLAVMPIILGIVFSMTAITDPNSSLAFWMSMIPFTSPMVMMARIPFGIPGWEIWLSLAILFVSFLFMIWVAAKIYRVGIFMYGKKPSVKDLIKWASYK